MLDNIRSREKPDWIESKQVLDVEGTAACVVTNVNPIVVQNIVLL